MSILDGSSILVTGGTGSFGKAFITKLLAEHNPKRVVIYSRDELKQWECRALFKDDPRLRWFIGDIRDLDRLKRAMHGVDYVVHAAALKQVDTAEYNPYEFVKTNVIGSQNVIEACIDAGVKKVVALSTDKASSPINLYGATKLTADKLFILGNHYAAAYPTRFAVVRYGNVMGSRGSIIPIFRRLAEEGKPMPITDERMTRYWLRIEDGVKFVDHCGQIFRGGETFVKKVPSMKITDLARAIQPDCELKIIGIRPGEKLHEAMVSEEESLFTYEYEDKFVIMPQIKMGASTDNTTYEGETGKAVPVGFSYTSENNTLWLTPQEIADYLRVGFWEDKGQPERSYDVAPGGVLTCDLTDLSAAEQQHARMALNAWSEVTGIRFNTTSTAG